MQIEITPEYLASQGLSPTFPERFWAKVKKTDGCWLWTGAINGYGYGIITKWNKRDGMITSHRAAWTLYHGPIPKGMCICHTCDTRNCVSIEHLFIGTLRDNIRDMVQKGRQQMGSMNGRAKLSDDKVMEIKNMLKNYPRRHGKMIGNMFGVGKQIISQIKNGTRWSHIKDKIDSKRVPVVQESQKA